MVCALACLLVGTVTLDQTARQLTRLTTPHQPRLRYLWIVIFMTMASIGIYIGRFLRLHSIYLLFTPTWFFRQLWSIWSGRTAAFVVIMTILQLIVYWLLKVCQHFSIDDNK
ncbi:MAG TPA: DUF1361 domain-containing protein, partial [Limosilactobacillus pontis]|nr:DUF1361 domain-containing protein [Limosilactobacillus pontis]